MQQTAPLGLSICNGIFTYYKESFMDVFAYKIGVSNSLNVDLMAVMITILNLI